MKTNVATDIQDTSDAMKTIIGTYLNRRYFSVLRAINWEAVNDDYTVSVVAGTASYTMPSDFRKELYVVDSTNNLNLTRVPLGSIGRNYPSGVNDSGTANQYSIFVDDSGDTIMKLHYVPATSSTFLMPYIISPVAMSGDTDEPILNLADLLESGAKADAWRYKKQFNKAGVMESLYTKELSEWIWDYENQTNEVMQAYPSKQRIQY